MVPPPLHVWVREVGAGRDKGLSTEPERSLSRSWRDSPDMS